MTPWRRAELLRRVRATSNALRLAPGLPEREQELARVAADALDALRREMHSADTRVNP